MRKQTVELMWFFLNIVVFCIKRENNMHATAFTYHPQELSSYAVSFGTFIIALKNGDIVHHEPEDSMEFHEWLQDNEVQYLALRN